MIVIDGSFGEGGGQILRTSLALSLLTGKPFRMENIRARRKSPGLLRQHLTAVQAAAEIGGASIDGATVNSTTLAFIPRDVKGGEYRFAIGTAGSTTLVLQTILLPLLLAKEPSTVIVEGGTHNPSAPPFDFLEQAFVPLLRKMGAGVELELVRPGFYPAGGGAIRATIEPARQLRRLELHQRGAIVQQCARAVVANLPYSIAQREVQTIGEELGWGEESLQAHTWNGSAGPGNVVSITIASENVTEVFTGFGERGVRAEDVALRAAKEAKRYLDSGVPVGEHLADQLVLPLAVGEGGVFTTTALSQHATTNLEIIKRFVDVSATVEETAPGVCRVRVTTRA